MMHDLVTGLDACKSNADIQVLLEENQMSEAFWKVINSSRWPKEQVVNITTKDFLLQHLVVNELLTSRKNELDELKEGLKALGFLDLISKNKEACRVLFNASHGQMLNQDILGIIIAKRRSNILYICLRSSLLFIAVRMI